MLFHNITTKTYESEVDCIFRSNIYCKMVIIKWPGKKRFLFQSSSCAEHVLLHNHNIMDCQTVKRKKKIYINCLVITNLPLCMIWRHIDYIYKQQSIVCVSSWQQCDVLSNPMSVTDARLLRDFSITFLQLVQHAFIPDTVDTWPMKFLWYEKGVKIWINDLK